MDWWFEAGILFLGLLTIVVLAVFLDRVGEAMETRADRKCEYHRQQEEYLRS